MKNLFFVLSMAVLLLAGCKKDEGNGFEPTKLGFGMFCEAHAQQADIIDCMDMLRHLDEYIAVSDEQRAVLHERYFRNTRIVELANIGCWVITPNGSYYDVEIYTRGKGLGDEGAVWEVKIVTYDSYPYKREHRSLSAEYVADDTWALSLRKLDYTWGYETTSTADLTYKILSASQVQIGGSGRLPFAEKVNYNDIDEDLYADYTISKALVFDSDRDRFISGSYDFRFVYDGSLHTPAAEYSNGQVTVYGGENNAYNRTYWLY